MSHQLVQIMGLEPNLLFDVSAFFVSLSWIINSTLYHFYLHMTREEGLKKVDSVLRWHLKTRLSNFIARSHRTHHTMGAE